MDSYLKYREDALRYQSEVRKISCYISYEIGLRQLKPDSAEYQLLDKIRDDLDNLKSIG